MMRVLAVDTTSEYLDMALAQGSRVRRKRIRAAGRQDEKLFVVLNALLRKAGWKLKDLDVLAAASGPGSFTGIRVGMTFVSMLARTLGKPAVAVSLLEAEAFRASRIHDPAGKGLLAVAMSAPRDEMFFQPFVASSAPKPYREPQWVHPAQWASVFRKMTSGRPTILIGTAAKAAERHFPTMPKNLHRVIETSAPRAEDLVAPALNRIQASEARDFEPLYLRPAYYERGGAQAPNS